MAEQTLFADFLPSNDDRPVRPWSEWAVCEASRVLLPDDFPEAPGVYAIIHRATCNPYVGGSRNARKRLLGHRRLLSAGNHPSPRLMEAWRRYGADAFDFAMIEPCEVAEVVRREQVYLDRLRPWEFGLNVHPNATGFGLSDEVRRKMSESQRGNRNMVGYVIPFAVREKMSEAMKGKKRQKRPADSWIVAGSKQVGHPFYRPDPVVMTDSIGREVARYASVNKAAKANGLTCHMVRRYAESGQGERFRFRYDRA